MGNQSSRSSAPQSPTSHGNGHSHAHHHSPHNYPHNHLHNHTARRRESIQALSAAKALAAPPSATLDHAESQPTHIHAHAHAHPHALTRPLSRGPLPSSPALTVADTVASHLRTAHDSLSTATATSPAPTTPTTPTMGNEQSSHKAKDKAKAKDTPSPHTRPVDVPAATRPEPRADPHDHGDLAVDSAVDANPDAALIPASASHDFLPAAHFNRPPRLPLPIEEEVQTPGSPIISSQDLSSPIDHGDVEGALPKRSSMLSTTTADDDDLDLGDEFKSNTGRPTVSTLIEWHGPGERVYVTGTFAGWNRKYRLHRNGPSPNKDALSAHVLITPGTHHLMFLVDNEMKTSDSLPTAVDYTNILVNYLEVSYDDVPSTATTATATTLPASSEKPSTDATIPVQKHPFPSDNDPPHMLPPSPPLVPVPVKTPLPEPPKPPVPEPTKRYHQNIPRYLLDLDAPDESSRFARANAVTNNLPTPPTLPGFLGKSILNGTTPTKDDSSVLIHPNHTVLNHLATSSIKDGVLATSATTRYRQKFLTTIMYKPKEERETHVS